MGRTGIYTVALFCACLPHALASEISGRITIEKGGNTKLVAPAVYDLRGVALSSNAPVGKTSSGYERVGIWLESNAPEPAPAVKAEMRQRNQHLDPDLLVVPVGSTVDFPNLDPIFHNIFSRPEHNLSILDTTLKGAAAASAFPMQGSCRCTATFTPTCMRSSLLLQAGGSASRRRTARFPGRMYPPATIGCAFGKNPPVSCDGRLSFRQPDPFAWI